jgi:hypothetical protein
VAELERLNCGSYVKEVDESSDELVRMYNEYQEEDEPIDKKKRTRKKHTEKEKGEKKDQRGKAGENASKRAAVVHSFLCSQNKANPSVIVVEDDALCRCCGSSDIRTLPSKATLTCQRCGHSFVVLDANPSTINLGDDVSFTQSFSYLRINHFSDWLLRVQAKESYSVPEEVLQNVMEALANANVKPEDVCNKTVLSIMKKKKMKSRVYNHVSQICQKLTGIPPPRLSSEQDDVAKLLFCAIQEPFERHCPSLRKNFLSYSYVVFRILELLGCDELLGSISLLSGKGKISAQDEIMKKIFEDLDLEWSGCLE